MSQTPVHPSGGVISEQAGDGSRRDEAAANGRVQPGGANIRVLLVEDNPDDADLLRRELGMVPTSRFDVTTAGSIKEALHLLGSAAYEIALLDLFLPDSTGLDGLRALHHAYPHLPVIIMSGLTDGDLALQAVQAGAQDYLVKGKSSGEVLVRVIRYAIERQRAEGRLIESETKYRTLMEQASDAIVIMDQTGHFVEVNSKACELVGYTAEEMLQLRMEDTIAPEDLAARPPRMEPVQHGDVIRIERVLKRKDGKTLPIEASTKLLPDGRIQSIVRDMTERKRMEDALAASEAQFRDAFDYAAIGMSLVDLDGRWLKVNRTLCNIVGYTEEELLGLRFQEITHPDDLDIDLGYAGRMLAGEIDHYQLEKRYIHKLGHVIWIQLTVTLLRDAFGKPVHFIGQVQDITERKRAEDAVRKLNEELEQRVAERTAQLDIILRGVADGITVQDPTGKIIFANQAALKILGYSTEHELLVTPMPELLAKFEMLDEHHQPLPVEKLPGRLALQGKEGGELVVCWHEVATGDERWSIVKATPAFDEQGQVRMAINIIVDITNRKLIEEENARLLSVLQSERQRLDAIIDNVPGLVWEAWGSPDDNNQRIDFVSNYVEDMLGYTVEEWLSTPNFWLTIVHPDDREEAARVAAEQFASGKGGLNHFRWITSDGRVLQIQARSVVVKDAEGKPVGLRGVSMDITERSLAEEQIKARARQQAAAAELGGLALSGLDVRALMDTAAQSIAETLDVEYTRVLELLPDENALLLRSGVGWQEGTVGNALVVNGPGSHAGFVLAAKEPVAIEDLTAETRFEGTELLHNHGVVSGLSVIIEGTERPFGVLSAYTTRRREFSTDDINFLQSMANLLSMAIARKKAEQEIVNLNLSLQYANNELEAFTYSVSHDLQAPLRALTGFSNALREDYSDLLDTGAGHYLDRITLNAQRMGQLINDLLAFSRLSRQPLSKVPVDVGELATSVMDELRQTTAGRDIVFQLQPGMTPAEGDPTLLREVLANLLSNAVKFTRGREYATVEVGGYEDEQSTTYYVRDNGAGFDMRYASKLFGVFQRLHATEDFEGTGVGLALVQRIITRHGGRVWGEGQVDGGATFFFSLPRT